ncbi:hypothetical protein H0H92_008492 [Tricholoma furcatifolium]|nr:hypothetical protein H0H92_008492 [Tricholoma furcatifolium]
MPTEQLQQPRELNSYNVQQLQFALGKDEIYPDLSPNSNVIPIEPDLDYASRRMSTSTTTDTDSAGEKRSLSPQPKKDEKVQLPSIFTTFDDSHPRRASLPSLRQPNNTNNLSTYTFPQGSYDAPGSGFSFGSPGYGDSSESWSASGIVRPSSTPGQIHSPAVKYEDVRHASFSGAPMSQAPQMFAGSARISGQDRRSLSGIKTEWSFPNNPDYSSYSPNMPSATPSIAVSNSPSRSPQSIPSSTLVDRPQRKRGKLPKETTDYLKAWLHRHSDHPYPSEEEKKALCSATGLSMSQVSNWMINARRRILAPAHRAASGPTTTAPFPPSSRSASLGGLLDHNGRRASMPSPEALSLYTPMTLQTVHSHHDYSSSTRSMLGGLPVGRSTLGPASGVDFTQRHHGHSHGGHMNMYSSGHGHGHPHGPHSAGPTPSSHHYGIPASEIPLSAPAYGHHPASQGYGPSYSSRGAPPPGAQGEQGGYFNDGHSHSGSTPGSGYATPQ